MLSAAGPPQLSAEWLHFGLQIVLNPWMIAGLLCYGLSIAVWLAVLSRVEVSAAYPLLSIGYVITAVVGFFFLGENVSAMRLAGIALICGGLVLITRTA